VDQPAMYNEKEKDYMICEVPVPKKLDPSLEKSKMSK